MQRRYVLAALIMACSSGKGGSETGAEILPFGTADCRVECEAIAEFVVLLLEMGSSETPITLAEVKQQCQELPTRTTCEECNRQISFWLDYNFHAYSDCNCYFEDEELGMDDDWCDELIDGGYGGSKAALAEECQTCPSAD